MKFKKLKKVVCLALATTVALGFAACKDKEATGSSEKISFYCFGDEQPDLKSVLTEANKIIEPKLGATLDLKFIDTPSYNQKLNMMMASGGDFDICFVGFCSPYKIAVDNGSLLNLDDYIQKMPALKKSLSDKIWTDAKYKGHIYAVPNNQVMCLTWAYEIDKALADKYQFDISTVKKPEDIEPFLEMVAEGESNVIPFRNSNVAFVWNAADGRYADAGAGCLMDKKTGEIVSSYETSYGIECEKTLNSWYHKGYIRKDALTVGDDTADYNSGRYAVSPITYKPGMEATTVSRIGKECYYVEFGKPFFANGSTHKTMLGISSASKHKDKAIKLIEMLNTDKDLYRLICHGIKDKHYKMIDDNTIKYIENSGYCPNADWAFGNQFNAYVYDGQPKDVWKITEERDNNADVSPVPGFMLDTEPITSKLSQVATAVKQLPSTLTCDPSLIDKYRKNGCNIASKSGYDDILKEVKKQVKEYKKANNIK